MNWTEEQVNQRNQGAFRMLPCGHPQTKGGICEIPWCGSKKLGRPSALPPAIGRIAKPEMNKTEARYAAHLELQKNVGAVLWWGFETFTVKLGKDCRFTPDFAVMFPDGHLEFHDTKGAEKIKIGKRAGETKPRFEDDALVKARVAAANCVIPVYFVWPEKNGEWGRREL